MARPGSAFVSASWRRPIARGGQGAIDAGEQTIQPFAPARNIEPGAGLESPPSRPRIKERLGYG